LALVHSTNQGSDNPEEEVKFGSGESPSGPRVVNTQTGTFTINTVETKNMEEDEEVLFNMRVKLHRFDSVENTWKERGIGNMKFLKHNDTGKIRVLMRQEKTLKICANHYFIPQMALTQSSFNDKTWVYTAHNDFSDGEAKVEMLAVRLNSKENSDSFKEKFEEVVKTLPTTKE